MEFPLFLYKILILIIIIIIWSENRKINIPIDKKKIRIMYLWIWMILNCKIIKTRSLLVKFYISFTSFDLLTPIVSWIMQQLICPPPPPLYYWILSTDLCIKILAQLYNVYQDVTKKTFSSDVLRLLAFASLCQNNTLLIRIRVTKHIKK